ncbi:ParB N-terminal domain-containing protein [Pseudobacteroides cellulosolvens]|uniref:ParB domain protein nuclease n=1 Tax=Pseudobacteroides cellulosolvens ATCC 35603 = DSM 2933 TaxID=398512 RepID=A0A0L6JVS9_9FIRM|nr:ParB N-terminal domain-containing protein [Pseudobacteroides cellulosolvens]KNY29542.1 ParB domain protein nuclease [Pseudobacteroides cellulosolvens ATCC 35603 = DSM 2933]
MVTRPTAKKVKSLDELLMADEPTLPIQANDKVFMTIAFDKIRPYQNHPFRLYSDERLDDLVESIKANGVLVPMIVRKIECGEDGFEYEMLAGHNRMNGAKFAGLTEGPCIVKEYLTDEEALMYVVETNVIQRSFTDMLPSEKSTVLSLSHSKMFSQGKRNDIIDELKRLENPEYIRGNETSAPVGQKLTTREKVGNEYGLSKNTVARLLRIDKVINALKDRVDNNEISIRCAVDISYLKETEQKEIEQVLSQNEFKVDMKKTQMLRSYSNDGKLNEKVIYQILSGEINKKPKSTNPSIKIKHKVYSKFFSPDVKSNEIEKVVEEALELFFEMHPERKEVNSA